MTVFRRLRLALPAALLATVGTAKADGIPLDDRQSGLAFVSPQTRALQADDASNPGMLWVLEGERLWRKPAGATGAACASCHGEASESMRGVAPRYPLLDEGSGRPLDLQGRINQCRTERQDAPPLALEGPDLLALTSYVAHQSRGLPVTPASDERLAPFIENGRELFQRPIGQLDLSCSDCHEARWGERLGGSLIPQAHPTAYPIYRLEWQTLGSLQRRMRNCMIGVRAEPHAYGAPELVELELFLMSRAAGLPIETPGVRP